jgi:serine-type D-Ala-D-Ala carboxypeptidase (penicillin-binding protein 5/6)
MHKSIKGVIFTLVFSICFSVLTPIRASAIWNPPATPTCNAVYLINEDTGTVLYQKNQNEKIYPASITKLMTAILVYEKFKDKLDTVVTVEKGDLTPLSGTGGMLVPLKNGEQLTVEQLLYCLLIRSGDDSANVLARAVAGSVDDFVDMMNAKAKKIGLTNTHYVNPHGLHDEDHYTTAYDIYTLAKYAMSIDELAKIVAISSYTLPATNKSKQRKFTNTNSVINNSYKSYYYKYVKGIKTGTTTPAGACLVSYAEKDGVTYYCVAMGGSKASGLNTAFTETRALYQWAFGNFEITPVATVTDAATQVDLELAVNKTKMLLVPQTQLNAIVPSTYKSSDLKITYNVPDSVTAPVKKGEKIGTEDIAIYNEDTKSLQKLGTVNLIASEDAVLSKPLYVLSLIKKFFNSIWFKIVAVLLILLLVLYVLFSVYYNRRRKMLNRRKRKKYTYRK